MCGNFLGGVTSKYCNLILFYYSNDNMYAFITASSMAKKFCSLTPHLVCVFLNNRLSIKNVHKFKVHLPPQRI